MRDDSGRGPVCCRGITRREVKVCGRSQLLVTVAELFSLYRIDPPAGETALGLGALPRWSVAPTQVVPTVRGSAGRRTLDAMRWGYPMSWLARQGKDPWSRPLINAKAEDAADKKTWAESLRQRRCVVPATAFYEWLRAGRKRFPVELSPAQGRLLHLAGIWQRFEREGEPVSCVSILTTTASDDVRPVHHRMPVLLGSLDAVDAWLDPSCTDDARSRLLASAPPGTLCLRPMHTRLNHWSAQGDGLRNADWTPGEGGVPPLGAAAT